MYVVIYQSHGWYGDLESSFHHRRFLFRNLQATLLSSMDGDPEEGNKTSFGCLSWFDVLVRFLGGKTCGNLGGCEIKTTRCQL